MIVNLSKNNNFSISGAGSSGVIVNGFNGSYLFSTNVSNAQGEKQVIGIADEAYTLYDGRVIKRIKDNIQVI